MLLLTLALQLAPREAAGAGSDAEEPVEWILSVSDEVVGATSAASPVARVEHGWASETRRAIERATGRPVDARADGLEEPSFRGRHDQDRIRLVAAVSPDGEEVWLGLEDGDLRRVDASTGATLGTRALGSSAIAAIVFVDGSHAVVLDGAGRLVRVDRELDVARERLADEGFEPDDMGPDDGYRTPYLERSPDGRVLVCTVDTRRLRVVDSTTLADRFTVPFSDDGPTREQVWAWGHEVIAVSVAEDRVVLLDPDTGIVVGPELRTRYTASEMAFRPGTDEIWIGEERWGHDRTTRLSSFRTTTGELLDELEPVPFDVFFSGFGSLCFVDDGRPFLCVGKVGNVVALDPDDFGEVLWQAENWGGGFGRVLSRTSHDGTWLYTWGQCTGNVAVFDAVTGRAVVDYRWSTLGRILPFPRDDAAVVYGERVEVRELPSGERRWTRFDWPGGEWALQTASGWFDGTPGALERIHVVVPGSKHRLLDVPELVDPARVRAEIAGEDVDRPPKRLFARRPR